MNLNQAELMARQLMKQHDVTAPWHFHWSRGGETGFTGQTDYNNHRLRLSRYKVERRTEDQIRNTILHEIAHILVGPNHNHDKTWMDQARALGCTFDTDSSGTQYRRSQNPDVPSVAASTDTAPYATLVPVSEWITVGDVVRIKAIHRSRPEHHGVFRITKQNPKNWWAEDEDGKVIGWDYRVWELTDRPFVPRFSPVKADDFALGEVVTVQSDHAEFKRRYAPDTKFVVVNVRDRVKVVRLGGEADINGWMFPPQRLTKVTV